MILDTVVIHQLRQVPKEQVMPVNINGMTHLLNIGDVAHSTAAMLEGIVTILTADVNLPPDVTRYKLSGAVAAAESDSESIQVVCGSENVDESTYVTALDYGMLQMKYRGVVEDCSGLAVIAQFFASLVPMPEGYYTFENGDTYETMHTRDYVTLPVSPSNETLEMVQAMLGDSHKSPDPELRARSIYKAIVEHAPTVTELRHKNAH